MWPLTQDCIKDVSFAQIEDPAIFAIGATTNLCASIEDVLKHGTHARHKHLNCIGKRVQIIEI